MRGRLEAKHARTAFSAVALLALAASITHSVSARQPAASATQTPAVTDATSPVVKVLTPPDFWGSFAIWGATGVDRAGRIFLGITSNDERGSGSAHLVELNPVTGTFTDRGNVVAELERLGLRRPGETQMKIHSRIVQATDGYQYFASMDESGENEDGSKLPTWGGHLWRRGSSGAWEHLKATPEALIAVGAGGPFVYALGYFDHVLYQFDTRNRRIRSIIVGATGGHVSRNFLVDEKGHAFVPRVTQEGAAAPSAMLVEYDQDLREIGAQRLAEYFERGTTDSHGIVGLVPDGGAGWFFTTGRGRLYHESPASGSGFVLEDLGWMHPAGPRYPASLFRDERTGSLYSMTLSTRSDGRSFDWISRTSAGMTTLTPLSYGDEPRFPFQALLYGSMARDEAGRCYVVGMMNYKPVVLQVAPPR